VPQSDANAPAAADALAFILAALTDARLMLLPVESGSTIYRGYPYEARSMNEPTSPTLNRLEDQIRWYDAKSQRAQRWFKALKILQLVVAGGIPLIAVFAIERADRVTALLGLVILVVEGLQQLNQYQANWISYRSTCEALQHEKFLFLAKAGPYKGEPEPLALLAERIEGLISQEHAKWISAQEQDTRSGRGADNAVPGSAA